MSQRRRNLETAATAFMLAAAALMVGSYMSNGLGDERSARARAPEVVETWQEENAGGFRVGPIDAPVAVTVFTDFECPYCAQLAERLDTIVAEFPREVAVVVQHYPLTSHRNAAGAAVAVECAERQNRFTEMSRVVFARTASLGTEPWIDFAAEAGVPDLDAFTACSALPVDSFPRITFGLDLGERTGVRGTPTVWINGEVVGSPDLEVLREKIRNARS